MIELARGKAHMSAAITVRNVSKAFHLNRRGHFVVLQDVSFEVAAGEFVVLVGPSGCGKTTLLDLIGGLTKPDGGTIHVGGRPIQGPGLDRGIVFQQYALFPWKTAQGNVEFGLEAKGTARADRAELARHYLDLVGLSGFEDRFPHELSGGMKQRVAIARALSYDPDVLLLDEPFAALDAQTRETLQDELLRIWRRTGKTIVFITHGIDEAVYLGQRVLVMAAGPGRITHALDVRLNHDDPAQDLRATPEFVRLRHEIWELIHHRRDVTRPLVAHAA
ncbi:ABC transporter [Caballeronia arationis]|uniref:ABC-type nitrate/sulfonate/bicarbonate transport system, ATPase component n=2 Tax=Caballeronia arationis TaxID=1777142 RepID=A0A7Z7N0J7_9BURK|nr:ABC transporter [Caballeronia arationis]SOE53148.1 ABC-type nitrate/sulfonate/bicarbonate transport system, ATPase component [Caballeronia arationis]